jgi:hypothetical protein
VGNAGCPLHPRSRVHLVVVESTRVTTSTPESPGIPARNGFTAYFVISPVTGSFATVACGLNVASAPGRADTTSAKLDASTGASGPHDFAVRSNVPRPRAVDRSQISSTCPAISLHAKRCRVHRIPSRVRDDHDTPLLWGGMAKVLEMIWGEWKQESFCKGDSTSLSTNRPTGKSPDVDESKFSRVPDAVQRSSLLRRAGTHSYASGTMAPGSAAHHCVLRGVRGTRSNPELRGSNVMKH